MEKNYSQKITKGLIALAKEKDWEIKEVLGERNHHVNYHVGRFVNKIEQAHITASKSKLRFYKSHYQNL